ncbi:MAG: MBL fold metallo-hydrolase [Candidatus Diapherotrites archaeon]|nr:MBL fold metallo-hydrolase [Candidatus Diapherotrites archaeon]
MSELKVLIEGYARKKGKMEFASPSTVLINDSGLKVIADPGANEKLLLKALSKEGLKPEGIDLVFLTHYHPDHLLNIGLFRGKKILDGNTIYCGEEITGFSGKIPGTKIKVIATPGHAHEHASLLVETKKGKVLVAGDVWWWADGEKQKTDLKSLLSHKDPYVKDKKALRKSRKKALKLADYIIPGHGKIFAVKK